MNEQGKARVEVSICHYLNHIKQAAQILGDLIDDVPETKSIDAVIDFYILSGIATDAEKALAIIKRRQHED